MRPRANVRSTDPAERRPSRAAGIVASLGGTIPARLWRPGRPRRAVLVMLAAVLLVGVALAAQAAASNTPVIKPELHDFEVFSTRAHIEAFAELSNTEAVEATWSGEYAPAEPDGSAPAAGSKAWKLAGGATETRSVFEMPLGAHEPDANDQVMLQHLAPSTTYYARFHVSDTAGPAQETFKFKTFAATTPEIAKNGQPNHVSPRAR